MNNRMVWVTVVIGLALLGVAMLPLFIGTGGGDNPTVEIDTSMGKITVELYANKAPISVRNFLAYVDDKAYDGTVFHRVISNFMIQGGGFTEEMERKKSKRAPIKNEAGNGLKNERGTVAMARTDEPDSATNEFFINVVENKDLDRSAGDPGYAVFGKVTKGMEIVDKIRRVRTTEIPELRMKNVPVDLQSVLIKSIRRVE